MKDRLFSILTALLIIAFTFTFNSLAQDSLLRDLESQPKDLRDGKRFGQGKYRINDIKFSPDGTRFAVAGNFGILLYDVQRRGKKIQKVDNPVKLAGHQGRGWRVAFSPNGRILASANATGTLYLWDAKTEKLLQTIEGEPGYSSFSCMAFSPDGRMLVTGGNKIITRDPWISEGIVRLWDAQTGEHIRTLTGHTRHVNSVAFSSDGRTIATGGSTVVAKDGSAIDGTVRLWDMKTGQHLQTLTGHTHNVNSVAFSPDGMLLASGGHDKPVRLWDVKTGQQIRALEEGGRRYSTGPRDPEGGHIVPIGPPNHVAFSPDGRTLASASHTGIRLWDVNRGRLLRKFGDRTGGHGTSLLVFSPDGRTIAVCGSEEIDLWDMKTGKQIQRVLLEQNKWETYR